MSENEQLHLNWILKILPEKFLNIVRDQNNYKSSDDILRLKANM